MAQHRRRNIVGTPEQVRQKLNVLLEQYGVEEAAIISITHDFGARKRTYELLAQVYGLQASLAAAE